MSVDMPARVRSDILLRAHDGDTLEQIEHDLIEPCPVGEDAKSGLWLYAWTTRALRRRGPTPSPLSAAERPLYPRR
ncbi:MAG TPA: hypothetical protein VHX88_20405 [Solirubrobacteraceae bacterium]|nr:hypothetical protein [Solirubrobacteraceae bacterium]